MDLGSVIKCGALADLVGDMNCFLRVDADQGYPGTGGDITAHIFIWSDEMRNMCGTIQMND